MSRTYKCPYCNTRLDRDKLVDHIDKQHEDIIPEGFTSSRIVFNLVNKKEYGSCRVCKGKTPWNEKAGKYDVLCGKQSCKDKLRDDYKKNMLEVKGTYNILNDPEQQKLMLANRSISGEYEFSTGGKVSYTGTYEKKALEHMDIVFGFKSSDIMSPGPTMKYMFEGKELMYIPDFYLVPFNLIIEIKDGGDNPNNRSMGSYRDKTIEKERLVTNQGIYNYVRLTNNQFPQLWAVLMELKKNNMDGITTPIVRVNEAEIVEDAFYVSQLSSLQYHEDEVYLSPTIDAAVENYINDKLSDGLNIGYTNTDRSKLFVYKSAYNGDITPIRVGCINVIVFDFDNLAFNWEWAYKDDLDTYDAEFNYDDMSNINESYIINKDDIYFNMDKFESGKSNVILLTGLSGSGKSTLAKELCNKYKAKYIELDMFENCYVYDSIEDVKDDDIILYGYFNKNMDLFNKLKSRSLSGKELAKEIIKFLDYEISYCKRDKSNKYVIEGVQIYSFMSKKDIGETPLIIKNTSAITSIVRRLKRSYDLGQIKSFKDLKDQEIFNMIAWYMGEEKAYKLFKDEMINESYILSENYMILESVEKSKFDDNHINGDRLNLSKFKKVSFKDWKSVQKYTDTDSYLKTDNGKKLMSKWADGYIFIDTDNDELVGYVAVDNKTHSICPIEICPKYRNHGLSKQILQLAIRDLKAEWLYVNDNNEVALQIYKDIGFETIGKYGKKYAMALKGTESYKKMVSDINEATFDPETSKNQWWYCCMTKTPSDIDEEQYYKTREAAVKCYAKDEFFKDSDTVKMCLFTCNGNRTDDSEVENPLKPIYVGDILVNKDKSFTWINKKILDADHGVIYETAFLESAPKESLQELLDHTDFNDIILSSDWHIYKEMNSENQIKWEDAVGNYINMSTDKSVFLYLGDMSYRFSDKDYLNEVKKIFKSLKAKVKILVLGNHDVFNNDFYNEAGFDYVLERIDYKNLIFTHKPVDMGFYPDDYVNIHGHIHYSVLYHDTEGKQNINVYPGKYDMKPITLQYALDNQKRLVSHNHYGTKDESAILTEQKRSELPDSAFGVPEERKYPLESPKHVRSAIKLFNHVDKKYEKELAENIIKKMKQYDIHVTVGETNRFGKYYKEPAFKESYRVESFTAPVIGIDNSRPIIVTKMMSNTFSGGIETFGLTDDLTNDAYYAVDENANLSVVNNLSVIEAYKYIGDRSRLKLIYEAYKQKQIVDPSFIYSALSGKDILIENQIDFDDNFVKINTTSETDKLGGIANAIHVTMEQVIGIDTSINYINNNIPNISIKESVNGIYAINNITDEYTKAVDNINMLTESLINSIM